MTSAIILAAGRGSRLEQLTSQRPKPLVGLGGMTLIERAIASLRGAGIAETRLVVGYKAESFDFLKLPCFKNPEWAHTGIFWSLRCAAAFLELHPAIVCYGDIFFEADDVARLMEATGDIVVAYDPAAFALWSQRFPDPFSDLENFEVDEDGRCARIGGKLAHGDRLDGQFTGLFKLTPRGWAGLCRTVDALPPARQRTIDMTSLLSLAIADGIAVHTVPLTGKWGEVDQHSDIDLYERLYFWASRLSGEHF
jgi:L-glutamine-phosphate cytidylyltransferase